MCVKNSYQFLMLMSLILPVLLPLCQNCLRKDSCPFDIPIDAQVLLDHHYNHDNLRWSVCNLHPWAQYALDVNVSIMPQCVYCSRPHNEMVLSQCPQNNQHDPLDISIVDCCIWHVDQQTGDGLQCTSAYVLGTPMPITHMHCDKFIPNVF